MHMWLIVSILVIFLYYRVRKSLTYWKRHGVPQDPMSKTLKNNFEVFTLKLSQAQLYQNSYKRFVNHRYFGIYQVFQKFLVINDPDLIKQITVKDFDHFVDRSGFSTNNEPLFNRNVFSLKGKEWKNMRSILDTAFKSSKMKVMFDVLQTHCGNFVTYFQNQTEDKLNCETDIRNAFVRFTSDVIAEMVFGYKYNSLDDPFNDFYIKAQLLFPENRIVEKFKRLLIFTLPTVGNYFGVKFFAEAGSNYFKHITLKNIQERQVRKIVRSDIIQTLMEAKAKGSEIKNIDMAAQAAAFYFAGTDTTVSTLCFISYELASNMEVQKRLQMEIDEVTKSCEGNITYTALQEMKYMHMVVLESLRKWTPIIIDRKCSKPYVIPPKHDGEVPVHIKKGDTIWIPMRAIQTNPMFYPNPEKLDPERFNDENKLNINWYRFCPFGVGPRTCIAKQFSLMMVKLLLFHVLKKFHILTNDKTVNPNQFGDLSSLTAAIPEFSLSLKLRN